MSEPETSSGAGAGRAIPDVSVLRAVMTVFLPFAGGYFLSYLFRSINAVIAPQLVSEVGLTAADLGLLTSAYFLAFAAFQLPLGLLLDRFGPRRVQATLLLSASAGAVVFSLGDGLELLLIGRALIGLGVAGGLMASFKAITLWFPNDRWAMVNGCFLAMGGLGAIAATAPTEAALQFTDWRGIFLWLSAITVIVAGVILTVVPEKPAHAVTETLGGQLRGLGSIFCDPLFWRVAPVASASLAASMAIQTLWAGPWMRDIAGFDRDAVAGGLLSLAVAMTAGFVLLGWVADYLRRHGVSTLRMFGVTLLLFYASQILIVFEVMPTSLLPWLIFGFTGNVGNLTYAHLSRHFPIHLAGRANTALNLLTFLSVFLTQYGIGVIIDLWPVSETGGYVPEAYRAALGAFLGIQLLTYFWFLVVSRKKSVTGQST